MKNEENRKRLRALSKMRGEKGKSEVDAAEPDAKRTRKEEVAHQVEEEHEDGSME